VAGKEPRPQRHVPATIYARRITATTGASHQRPSAILALFTNRVSFRVLW
jgi:hypothetical protein